MAGHSKWKNIRARKGKQDAVKGKVFTRLIREITVAARQGADISANSRLALAVEKARLQNMPRDTMERAIKRGSGGADDSNLEEVQYEGYGPSGVAIIVMCLTDNRNRTVADVRHAFTKHGGSLGTDGSVSYLFKQRGLFCFPPKSDENKIMEIALEHGAEDVTTNDDGSIDVISEVENFADLKAALQKAGLMPEVAEIMPIAANQIALSGEKAEKVLNLIEVLEELDDVQNVYSNADILE